MGEPNVEKMKKEKDLEELIHRLVVGWSYKEKIEAAEALGKIGDPRAVEPLIEALGDLDGFVYLEAAKALEKIGPNAVKPLIKALKKPPKAHGLTPLRIHHSDEIREAIRRWAAEILGKIGDPRAVGPLSKVLRRDKIGGVRKAAAEALGKIGDPRAVEPLIKALRDPDYVDEAAAEALGRMGDPRAVKPLINALRSVYPIQRRNAAKVLGEFGDERAVEPLEKALQDEDSDVRKVAKAALNKIRRKSKEKRTR